MKKFILAIILGSGTISYAQQDTLLKQTVSLKSNQIDQVLAKTEANIRPFVDNLEVRLDSGSKVISPKKVGGTVMQPVLNITIKKCVFLFCQTIDLDAEFSLKVVNGPCDHNYLLGVDLQRSSAMLTDLYSRIDTAICVKKTADGANATLLVNLIHASTYQSGIVQKQAYSLISLQGASILESFKTVMKLNGVQSLQ